MRVCCYLSVSFKNNTKLLHPYNINTNMKKKTISFHVHTVLMEEQGISKYVRK